MKINKHNFSDVARIGPDVVGINWLDVVLASESGNCCDYKVCINPSLWFYVAHKYLT